MYRARAKMSGLNHPHDHGNVSGIRIFAGPSTLLLLCVLALAIGCNSEKAEPVDMDELWGSYGVDAPSEDLESTLQDAVAIYPHSHCEPINVLNMSVSEAHLNTGEDGSQELCVWRHPAGCVPEGANYWDSGACDTVRTLGPSWFVPPVQRFRTDPKMFEDPVYRAELKWVRDQVAASGCSCCHASQDSGYASFFDIDAPGSWTDTLTMTGIVMAAGFADEHKYLGYLPPENNFGFDRETTIFATTDIPRMRSFFEGEFERRGGTAEDIQRARDVFIQINGSLFEDPSECGPGEGIDAQGNLVWKGGPARQIYIQEVGSANPGSPPNLDKPEGTIWGVYSNPDEASMNSGTVTPGIVPQGSRQAVPASEGTPITLEDGQQYRLFVTPDFLRSNLSNCVFRAGDIAVDPDTQECGSDNTVCAQVLTPEDLVETPEKLLVALYRTVPPIGPPDVFPPYSQDNPSLEPRTVVDVQLDASVTGTFYVYAVLYMPGGGLASWQPMSGVDYVAVSEAIELDGQGVVLTTPLVFDRAN